MRNGEPAELIRAYGARENRYALAPKVREHHTSILARQRSSTTDTNQRTMQCLESRHWCWQAKTQGVPEVILQSPPSGSLEPCGLGAPEPPPTGRDWGGGFNRTLVRTPQPWKNIQSSCLIGDYLKSSRKHSL